MNKTIIVILLIFFITSFLACSKESNYIIPTESLNSKSEQLPSTTHTNSTERFAEKLQDDLATFDAIPPSKETRIITKDEVNAYSIDESMKESDVVKLLGNPKSIIEENDEIFGKRILVYDGVKIIFIKTIYNEPAEDMEEVESAEFSDSETVFPRGIRIGDSLYDVLKKLPREYDYRTGFIYGDPYNKFSPGCATIGYEENNRLVIKISCGYWPLIKLYFSSALTIDSVSIVYNPNGIGT